MRIACQCTDRSAGTGSINAEAYNAFRWNTFAMDIFSATTVLTNASAATRAIANIFRDDAVCFEIYVCRVMSRSSSTCSELSFIILAYEPMRKGYGIKVNGEIRLG